jgi:hypothetical protein
MSNYIHNLAAKGINQAEVLRPRLASVFEPQTVAPQLAFEAANSFEPLDFANLKESAETANATERQRFEKENAEPRKALPETAASDAADERPTPVWLGKQQPPGQKPPSPEGRISPKTRQTDLQSFALQEAENQQNDSAKTHLLNPNETQRLTSRQGYEAITKAPPDPAKLSDSSLSHTAKVAVETNKQISEADATSSKPKVLPQIRRPVNAALANQTLKSLNSVQASADSGAAAISTPQPLTLRSERDARPREFHSSSQQSAPLAQEAQSAPTIHITIGRIEVRATTPVAATPPRKQTLAAPTLSLDEYLRRRNAGGER